MSGKLTPKQKRPFLGIYFRCCFVYGRIYRKDDGSYYFGHCPKCCVPVRVRVDPIHGTSTRRFFQTDD